MKISVRYFGWVSLTCFVYLLFPNRTHCDLISFFIYWLINKSVIFKNFYAKITRKVVILFLFIAVVIGVLFYVSSIEFRRKSWRALGVRVSEVDMRSSNNLLTCISIGLHGDEWISTSSGIIDLNCKLLVFAEYTLNGSRYGSR